MKYIITERQLKLIKEDEDKILKLDFDFFNNNWDVLQKFLERRGNPPYIITGDLDLRDLRDVDVVTLGSLVGVEGYLDLSYNKTIESLGNLQSVGGDLFLYNTNITSLKNLETVAGNLNLEDSKIESLGNLQSVGRDLDLSGSKIESLGNLVSVGGDLDLRSTKVESLRNLQYVGVDLILMDTPLSKTTTKEEIRNQVEVGGSIYL